MWADCWRQVSKRPTTTWTRKMALLARQRQATRKLTDAETATLNFTLTVSSELISISGQLVLPSAIIFPCQKRIYRSVRYEYFGHAMLRDVTRPCLYITAKYLMELLMRFLKYTFLRLEMSLLSHKHMMVFRT